MKEDRRQSRSLLGLWSTSTKQAGSRAPLCNFLKAIFPVIWHMGDVSAVGLDAGLGLYCVLKNLRTVF